ncbi:hypothetical protein BH20ACI4_BH20ACI4_21770 [soil metagenome]
MKKHTQERCYMCNDITTTKEHVPPESFFPVGHRENLITVPSCEKHNNKNSEDVEYVGFFIHSFINSNMVAGKQFPKVLRAFNRRPNLIDLVYGDQKTINLLNGTNLFTIAVDKPRFRKVIKAIAYGLYFHYFKKPYYGDFIVWATDLTGEIKSISEELELLKIKSGFTQLNYTSLKMPHPSVFNCRIDQDNPENFIFEFQFYESFQTHLISLPFYQKWNKVKG